MKRKIKGQTYYIKGTDKVPAELMNPEDIARDDLVERVFKKIERMKRIQEWLAAEIDKELKAYLEQKGRCDWGNFQLTNFSGDKRIRYSFNELIDFTEEITIAKEKIFHCVEKWKGTDVGGAYLEALVKNAFGSRNLNKTGLLKLLTIFIQDNEWIEAQQLIKRSIRVVESKRYREFAIRKDKDSKFETLNLNFNTYGEQK